LRRDPNATSIENGSKSSLHDFVIVRDYDFHRHRNTELGLAIIARPSSTVQQTAAVFR
jgi:hypothetical protein